MTLMRPIKIYTASKRIHAAELKSFEAPDIHLNARWLDTANLPGNSTKQASKWQIENFDDIRSCDYMLLFGKLGDIMQGALVEVGYGMAWEKPIYVVMEYDNTGEHANESQIEQLPITMRPNPWMLMGENAAYKVMRRSSVEAVLTEIRQRHTPKSEKMPV